MNHDTRARDGLEIGLTGSTMTAKEPYVGFFRKSLATAMASVFADGERVGLLSVESFKLTSKICIYGGFFG